MIKIQLTKDLDNEVDEFYKNLFSTRDKDFIKPLKNLEILITKRGYKTGNKRKYIDLIIKNYDTIVRLKPSEFEDWMNKFDAVFKHDHKLFTAKFYKRIVKELRYKDIREKEYLEISNRIGVKNCVYCHAQMAVVANVEYYKVTKQVKKRIATFELDHYIAKSKYPFLATSFYNLYPSCSNCNKSKSINDIGFILYEENKTVNLEVFKFYLNWNSESEYWKKRDINELKFDFIHIKGDKKIRDKYEKMFNIEGVYNTQKDIIEELLHKRVAYSKSYNASLVSLANKTIFPDEKFIQRLLISNYDKVEDAHKRPLSKFTQDIARQILLIK